MGSSVDWRLKNEPYVTSFIFKRANRMNQIGGLDRNGIFFWNIPVVTLENWVNEGGYVIDSSDHEYTLDEFITLLEPYHQILSDGPHSLH